MSVENLLPAFGLTAATDDMREGAMAFLEERKAHVTGR